MAFGGSFSTETQVRPIEGDGGGVTPAPPGTRLFASAGALDAPSSKMPSAPQEAWQGRDVTHLSRLHPRTRAWRLCRLLSHAVRIRSKQLLDHDRGVRETCDDKPSMRPLQSRLRSLGRCRRQTPRHTTFDEHKVRSHARPMVSMVWRSLERRSHSKCEKRMSRSRLSDERKN